MRANREFAKSVRLALVMFALVLSVGSEASGANTTPEPVAESHALEFYPTESGFGSYVSLMISAGDTAQFNVTIGNAGTVKQEIRAYTAPVQTAINGGFQLSDRGTEPDVQTRWVEFGEREFLFAPGEGQNVTVTVAVPADARPGEYVTGMAAEQVEPFGASDDAPIKQRIRWTLPILITVPGELQPSFELLDATLVNQPGGISSRVAIESTGNAIIRPTGEIRILNEDNRVIGVSQITMDSVYPGTSTFIVASWPNLPSSDRYTILVHLETEDRSASQDARFEGLLPVEESQAIPAANDTMQFVNAALEPLDKANPPSMLRFSGSLFNPDAPIENARITMVTFQDGMEIDRYPIIPAITLVAGTTYLEARYALPGGFNSGRYSFEVTVEVGIGSTQSVLVTEPVEYEVVVNP